ncbi:hypothetical protein ACOME3_005773 [Neoechinorhynchus agilis]
MNTGTFDALSKGLEIMIQRSDGRIHAATITDIDQSRFVVSVEWRERNETKGKEIELDSIVRLNPTLKSRMLTSYHSKQKLIATINQGNVEKNRLSMAVESKKPVEYNRDNSDDRYSTRSTTSISYQKAENYDSDEESKGHKSTGSPIRPKDAGIARKSQCVKEVERIARKRFERRAQQAKNQQNRKYEQQRFSAAVFGNAFDEKQSTAINMASLDFAKMIHDYRQGVVSKTTKRLTVEDIVQSCGRITVSVRKRPMSDREVSRKEIDIVTISRNQLCIVHNPKEKVDLTKYLDNQKFRFDYAFDETTSTSVVYHFTTKPLVTAMFEDRSHAMCFAYGQTGSGKTYTMGDDFVHSEDTSAGIYSSTAKEIMAYNSSVHYRGRFSVFCSFFEIYCGKVFDLLNGRKRLKVLEDGNSVVQVVDIIQEHVTNHADIMKVIADGMSVRTSGISSANDNSSRSHAILQIVLKSNDTGCDYGKISLVDLAGSERGKDTSSSDKTCLFEGAEINKSLLALKECIRALGKKAEHVPFRGSMLTRVLRDSFIGNNSVVSMIAMISPTNINSEHTINTLRYADRVKELNADNYDDLDVVVDDKSCNSTKLCKKSSFKKPKLSIPPTKERASRRTLVFNDLTRSANDLFERAGATKKAPHARSSTNLVKKRDVCKTSRRSTMKSGPKSEEHIDNHAVFIISRR